MVYKCEVTVFPYSLAFIVWFSCLLSCPWFDFFANGQIVGGFSLGSCSGFKVSAEF
jgi:hypothetical protein